MRAASFEYFAPRRVDEALELLGRFRDDAKVLAGGQSLVPMMNMRLVRPSVVIDLNRVASLARVEVMSVDGRPAESGDRRAPNALASNTALGKSIVMGGPVSSSSPRRGLRLGALVRQQVLERDQRIASAVPLLAEAAPVIGHLQTRARGTVGGSLVHADPAAELPACMLALDATFHLESARGRRACRAGAFFRGLLATDLAVDELLAEVEIPAMPGGRAGHGFAEVARRHGDFALVGACAVVSLDAAGVCRHARLVVFGAGDVPHLARAAAGLVGERVDPARSADIGRAAADEIDARDDLHATAGYRRRVAAGLATRVLMAAAVRAEAA